MEFNAKIRSKFVPAPAALGSARQGNILMHFGANLMVFWCDFDGILVHFGVF